MSPRRRVQAALAPGAVKVRIMGATDDARAVAGLLIATANVEVIEEAGPYPTRDGSVGRMYLIVCLRNRSRP